MCLFLCTLLSLSLSLSFFLCFLFLRMQFEKEHQGHGDFVLRGLGFIEFFLTYNMLTREEVGACFRLVSENILSYHDRISGVVTNDDDAKRAMLISKVLCQSLSIIELLME